MGFRLVPKSVTLNDLERRNGRYFCVITLTASPQFIANRVKLVEVCNKCSPMTPVFRQHEL